jgi:hypothetical protein
MKLEVAPSGMTSATSPNSEMGLGLSMSGPTTISDSRRFVRACPKDILPLLLHFGVAGSEQTVHEQRDRRVRWQQLKPVDFESLFERKPKGGSGPALWQRIAEQRAL